MDADDKKQCNTFTAAKPTNLESNNLIKSECLKRTLDGLVTHIASNCDEKKSNVDESKHEPKSVHQQHDEEKADISPEISNKKSNDTSPMTDSNCSGSNGGVNYTKMNKSFSIHTFENSQHHHDHHNSRDDERSAAKKSEESDVTKSMAFTIDFSSGKQFDEQRHKNLLERFQNRHRRGVSLSKVDDEMSESNSSSQLNAKLRSPASAKLPRKNSRDAIESLPQKPSSAGGVRLREKAKTSQLRDASKRHSWSPRSSMVEPTPSSHHQQPQKAKQSNPLERHLKMHTLTKADVKPLPPTTLNIACLQPPLENKNKESHFHDDDQVSEAGTYTLDGDNYTEEQKEKMNIDKLAHEHDRELMQRKLEINESDSNVETDLEVIDLDLSPPPTQSSAAASRQSRLAALNKGRKNILEVSFCYQEPTAATSTNNCNNSKSKVSYLEKLKSRVKNIGDKTFHKTKSTDGDVGCFTSVTTSGILSKKPTLDPNPHLKRKNSLTKSQVDSSEYVQGLRNEKNSITDNDKSAAVAAGYQLNMYQAHQSPSKSRKESVGSSNTSISTAATKDDWIQEWARNAREYSRHKRTPNAPVMSSSYNFESSLEKSDQFGYFSDEVMSRSDCKPQYEEFGDNLEQFHQKNHRQKKAPTPEHNDERSINNLSDHEPLSISSARSRRILRDFDLNKQENPRLFNIKPPISPCRIPSPIGSVSNRQKRFGSKQMLYGSETDLTNDTELYLQRTAAAISTLQNIHQKNSTLRNSSLQNSPVSPLSPTRPPLANMQSSNKSSASHLPPHSRAQSATRNSIHKRNASLDSSRLTTTTTNVMSTSLQSTTPHHFDNNKSKKPLQQHLRHNSYDGMMASSAAPSHRPTNSKYSHFDQTYDDDYESMPSRESALPERQQHKGASIKQHNAMKQHSSSIKRSSSFNVKPQDNSSPARAQMGTPKMHNKYTKPTSAPSPTVSRIQKSASSSCFKDAMRSNNFNEFYINDDDDLNPNNQFTPSDSDDEENQKFSLTLTNDSQPISNTRYNKTFLMRCEQSKNKAGGAGGGGGGGKPLGVVACPNTPELPRRDVAARKSMRERASMPRDSSLNRIVDNKKPLSAGSKVSNNASPSAQAVAAGGKVTSKYLDISKYKPERGNNFLKRDESKNYLNREVKKSSSSACLQSFQRDAARASNRSSGGTNTNSRPSSASTNKKKDVKNPKEIELAMWKRRASYDPLKAAAEGRRKAEEAKRLAQQQQFMLSSESGSSAMRSSKSYHSGAAGEWIDDSDDSEFDD